MNSKRREEQRSIIPPIGPAPKDVPIVDLAAWTVISNVILNLDEIIAKR